MFWKTDRSEEPWTQLHQAICLGTIKAAIHRLDVIDSTRQGSAQATLYKKSFSLFLVL